MAKPKTFKRRVETDLSDEEVAERKDRLVQVNKALFAKKAEKSEAMQDFNSDLKGIRQSMRDLVAAIETGKDGEDIDVYERPLEDRNVVQVVRASDDEVIEERPMTADERQGELNLAGADAANDQGDSDEPGHFPPGKKPGRGKRQRQTAATAH